MRRSRPALGRRIPVPSISAFPFPGGCHPLHLVAMTELPSKWAMADTAEGTETEQQTDTRLAPPWNVIVHDDPVTLMNYVTRVLMDVFAYAKAKAEKLMMEVHQSGAAVVWTGTRERAELYASKLQAYHLLTTLERGDAD